LQPTASPGNDFARRCTVVDGLFGLRRPRFHDLRREFLRRYPLPGDHAGEVPRLVRESPVAARPRGRIASIPRVLRADGHPVEQAASRAPTPDFGRGGNPYDPLRRRTPEGRTAPNRGPLPDPPFSFYAVRVLAGTSHRAGRSPTSTAVLTKGRCPGPPAGTRPARRRGLDAAMLPLPGATLASG